MFNFLTLRRTPKETLSKQIRFHLEVATRHDVVQGAHPFEKRYVLERSRNTLYSSFMGTHAGSNLAFIGDGAIGWLIDPVDHVECCRFPCAIGSNNGDNLVLMNIKADAG